MDIKIISILFGISLVYGILHALGPGHGKSVITSFFLKEKQASGKAVFLSLIVSFVHTSSAVVLSFLLFFVLTGIKGMLRIKMQRYFMLASGVMILLTGLIFLFVKIFKKEDESDAMSTDYPKANLFLVGVAAGIVPCPASLMIMILCLSNGIAYAGLTSVAGISLGMFIVLSAVGFVSIKSRIAIVSISSKLSGSKTIVSSVLSYISISLIILIGLAIVFNFIF